MSLSALIDSKSFTFHNCIEIEEGHVGVVFVSKVQWLQTGPYCLCKSKFQWYSNLRRSNQISLMRVYHQHHSLESKRNNNRSFIPLLIEETKCRAYSGFCRCNPPAALTYSGCMRTPLVPKSYKPEQPPINIMKNIIIPIIKNVNN